jgi:hypothetical protein
MMSRRRSRSDDVPPMPVVEGFRDPEQAARALCEAVLAVSAVHGRANLAAVLGPALRQLACSAARGGLDVGALLAAGGTAVEAREPGGGSVNERLFDAVARAAQALLALCHREMDPDTVNEELYRAVLSAELFECATALPRDPDRCLTAALPRDLVLDLMYGLATQRQDAEDAFRRHAPDELVGDARDDLERAVARLRETGWRADVDPAMGVGVALWQPPPRAEAGMHGIAITFGRSVVGRESCDFVLRFHTGIDGGAEFAARMLYRAHLQQRSRGGNEPLDLDGRVLRQQPLSRTQWHDVLGAASLDGDVLEGCVRRVATLEFCAQATEQAWRRRLAPAAAEPPRVAVPASGTRH